MLYAFFWVIAKTNDKPTSTAYILYTQTTYGRLNRMLAKHNIKSIALPPRKVFTGSHVNATGFILDKAVDPSKPKSKNTIDI
jgi:hypothetical protein